MSKTQVDKEVESVCEARSDSMPGIGGQQATEGVDSRLDYAKQARIARFDKAVRRVEEVLEYTYSKEERFKDCKR